MRLELGLLTLVPASSDHAVTSLQNSFQGCAFPVWALEVLLQG